MGEENVLYLQEAFGLSPKFLIYLSVLLLITVFVFAVVLCEIVLL